MTCDELAFWLLGHLLEIWIHGFFVSGYLYWLEKPCVFFPISSQEFSPEQVNLRPSFQRKACGKRAPGGTPDIRRSAFFPIPLKILKAMTRL